MSNGDSIAAVNNPPSLDVLAEKIRDLLVVTLKPEAQIDLTSSLMDELGFDSLDMIETSFALEEYFGFEFSGRNPVEELDRRLGADRILRDGVLTPLGKQVLFERMPELAEVDLPDGLHATQLPQHFNILTYARLVKDFYDHAPAICPETGEATVLDELKLVSQQSRKPVLCPTGDEILEQWLDSKAKELASR